MRPLVATVIALSMLGSLTLGLEPNDEKPGAVETASAITEACQSAALAIFLEDDPLEPVNDTHDAAAACEPSGFGINCWEVGGVPVTCAWAVADIGEYLCGEVACLLVINYGGCWSLLQGACLNDGTAGADHCEFNNSLCETDAQTLETGVEQGSWVAPFTCASSRTKASALIPATATHGPVCGS